MVLEQAAEMHALILDAKQVITYEGSSVKGSNPLGAGTIGLHDREQHVTLLQTT